jgi:hypothetical protein
MAKLTILVHLEDSIMDNTTRQIVAFSKRILRAIEALQETSKAIADYSKATKDAMNSALARPSLPVRTETDFSPRIVQAWKSHEYSNYRLQKKSYRIGCITLVVLGIYTTLTYLLWWQNANNFREGNRAWVLVHTIDTTNGNTILFPSQLKVGDKVGVQVYVKNSGNTPARHARIGVVVVPQYYDQPWELDSGDQPVFSVGDEAVGPETTIAPAGTKSNSTLLWGQLSETDLAALANKRLVIYMHGRVIYQDIFGISHWTHFCAVLPFTGAWTNCKYGNEIDQNREFRWGLPW